MHKRTCHLTWARHILERNAAFESFDAMNEAYDEDTSHFKVPHSF